MVISAVEDVVTSEPPRSRRGRWLVAVIVAGLAVVYLAGVRSTHAALSEAGFSGWGATGKAIIGFSVHNGGLVPVTLLSVALRPDLPVVAELGPVGVASPSAGQMVPFHPATLGPGNTVDGALTERVICNRVTYGAATAGCTSGQFAQYGKAASTVVVRYRVLGVTMSQMFSPVPRQPTSGGLVSPGTR